MLRFVVSFLNTTHPTTVSFGIPVVDFHISVDAEKLSAAVYYSCSS